MRKDMSDDLVLSESQLRDIIERAARMSEQDGVSIAELRRIAHELDIDPQAVDRALAQVLTEEPVTTTHRTLRRFAASSMREDQQRDDSEWELEFPWGNAIRIFEVGFFAVALSVSLVVLASSGMDLLAGDFDSLLAALLSSAGAVLFLAGGRNALQLLRSRQPPLQLSEEGILNRTYWNATTLARWDEVVDIRETRYSWISEIVLSDPQAFRKRQILPIRVMMRVTSFLGVGVLPLYMPQLATPRDEAARQLSEALEARQLAAIREQRRLEAGVAEQLPAVSPEGEPG